MRVVNPTVVCQRKVLVYEGVKCFTGIVLCHQTEGTSSDFVSSLPHSIAKALAPGKDDPWAD
jgi:hypothetical protein